MAVVYPYLAFGLRVDSDIALAGLPSGSFGPEQEPDVVVRRAARTRARPRTNLGRKVKNLAEGSEFGDNPANGIFRNSRGYALHLAHEQSYVEIYLSSDGRCIDWQCSEDIEVEELAVLIEGAFLCAAASLQGRQPFHGGCVRIDGADVAILADSGSGKSTMLLALSQLAGVQVMTDDSFALSFTGTDCAFVFGCAALRVSDESAMLFGLDTNRLRPLHRMSSKRFYSPNTVSSHASPARPTSPIVLCMSRENISAPRLRPMRQRQAFSQLRHHMHPEWVEPPDKHRLARTVLDFVDAAEVFDLVVPDDLARLPDTVAWLHDAVQHGVTDYVSQQ